MNYFLYTKQSELQKLNKAKWMSQPTLWKHQVMDIAIMHWILQIQD